MKKFLIGFVLLASVSFVSNLVSAQTITGDVDPNPVSDCVNINNNLGYRDRDVNHDGEVSTLQDFLQSKGYLDSEPTGYFGLLTRKAVKDFQKANNISPVSGYVGPITRARIAGVCMSHEVITGPFYDSSNYTDPKPITTPTPTNPNTTPSITSVSGPQGLSVNQQGTWSINATDASNSALSYSVDWGDNIGMKKTCSSGTNCATTQSVQQSTTFTHTYSTAGVYTPKFTVTNALGVSAQTSISVKVGVAETTQNSTSISAPTGLSATSTASKITLTWNPVLDVKYYYPSRDGSPVGALGSVPSTSYSDFNVSCGHTYSYTVTAQNSSNVSSSPSSSVSVSTPACSSVSTNIKAEFVSYDTILVSWDAVRPVGYKGGYNIYKNGSLIARTRTDLTDSTGTTFYDNKNISCPSTQTYKVELFSYDADWNVVPSGVYSDSVTVSSGRECEKLIPTTKLLSPNGGERYKQGDNVRISWNATGLNSYNNSIALSVYKYRTDNNYYGINPSVGVIVANNIVSSVVSNDGFYDWVVPQNFEIGQYVVSISGAIYTDTSDSYFNVVSSKIEDATCGKTYPGTCTTGTLSNDGVNYENNPPTWICNGKNGGINASCLMSNLSGNVLNAFDGLKTNEHKEAVKNNTTTNVQNNSTLSCGKFTKILYNGITDKEVKCLQRLLNEKGFKVEGIEINKETEFFGRATMNALKKFQESMKLTVDGIFGTNTKLALGK